MAALFPFVPNVIAPFAFQPTLDGQQYAATVVWNLFGQRWYLRLAQLSGAVVFLKALVGSPDGVQVASAAWASGKVTLVTTKPHGYTVGQTVDVTVTGFVPVAYNGRVLALVVDAVTLTYPLQGDPGAVTRLGDQTYDVDLAAGYFDVSTLVFRQSSQTFEVSP